MVLKHLILPEKHFKANLFFPQYNPHLTHPTTPPQDYRGNTGQYWAILLNTIGQVNKILDSIVQYLKVSNNITSHQVI